MYALDYIKFTTLFPFERAYLIVARRAEELLRRVYGTGRREMWVLLCVTTNGRTQRDVGLSLGLHPNVIVKILDGMEEDQLLKRRRKRDDRRSQELEVTAKGQALIDRYLKERTELLREVFAPLDDEQIDQWRELSQLIVEGAMK